MAGLNAHQITEHIDNLIEAFVEEPEHLSPVETLHLVKEALIGYLHDYPVSLGEQALVIAPPLP